ncbi:MAG: hypothetical protein K6A44_00770 [bacterium]|nr:hypothetical protein [bacterium]
MANLDVVDIICFLKKAGEISVARSVAEGENKTEKVIEKLFKDSSFGTVLSQAKKLILNVTSDENIPLKSVYEVAEALNEKIPDDAEIIFGCIVDKNLKDEMKATILCSST